MSILNNREHSGSVEELQKLSIPEKELAGRRNQTGAHFGNSPKNLSNK
jgi:hypothetical protein